MFIELHRCKVTRGLWFNVGHAIFAIRFGPRRFIDRFYWLGKMRYPKV